MVQILEKEKILELVKLPGDFDIHLIDFDYGFQSKIFPHISKSLFEELKDTHADVYEMIVKAGVFYSFVLDIPKIKVRFSNYGINQYEQNKTRNAPWWDVRDLGLSWLKKADFYLMSALKILKTEADIGDRIDFFKKTFSLFDFEDFKAKIKISPSADVCLIMSDIMRSVFEDFKNHFPACDVQVFLENPHLLMLIKNYMLSKTIAEATQNSILAFLSTGIAIQYEELPWQKSVVLSPADIANLRAEYQRQAEHFLRLILDYLNSNKDKFPCIEASKRQKAGIISKKSGLFL